MNQRFLNPRGMLLLDAAGALVTAGLTGFVLAPGWIPTGLPAVVLYVLAGVAAVYFCISTTSYLRHLNARKTLRYLAFLNLAYAAATLILCALYSNQITVWALIYFPLEALVVAVLARWEWFVATDADRFTSSG
jgi:hypothetical protein